MCIAYLTLFDVWTNMIVFDQTNLFMFSAYLTMFVNHICQTIWLWVLPQRGSNHSQIFVQICLTNMFGQTILIMCTPNLTLCLFKHKQCQNGSTQYQICLTKHVCQTNLIKYLTFSTESRQKCLIKQGRKNFSIFLVDVGRTIFCETCSMHSEICLIKQNFFLVYIKLFFTCIQARRCVDITQAGMRMSKLTV